MVILVVQHSLLVRSSLAQQLSNLHKLLESVVVVHTSGELEMAPTLAGSRWVFLAFPFCPNQVYAAECEKSI